MSDFKTPYALAIAICHGVGNPSDEQVSLCEEWIKQFTAEREAQAVQREREAAKGLVGSIEIVLKGIRKGNIQDQNLIIDKSGPQAVFKLLSEILEENLATYNDNRKG